MQLRWPRLAALRCARNIPHDLTYKIMLCEKTNRAPRLGFLCTFSDLATDDPIRLQLQADKNGA